MRFQLLGCVQAWDGDRPVGLGARKQRLVLAVLAMEANRLVPTSRLVDLIWRADPPASARGMIHTYVSKLRAVLDHHGAAGSDVVLCGEPGGYRLRCDPERIDVHRFRALVSRARDSGDGEERVALLDEALGLWSGPALAGAGDAELRARLCGRLDEARLAAVEDRFEALLRLDHNREVIDELVALSEQHPDRQRLTGQLMLALHRAARTPEALQVYDHARRRLAEESGLNPAEELQHLHQAILRADPALTTRRRWHTRVPTPPTPVRPAQLPADLPLFTGRRTELDHLLALSPEIDHGQEAVVITAIDGMAGIGKTALAVHFGHRVADRFPGGQLFIDLHGYTHNVAPVEPADALERLLGTLDIVGERIPANLDDRAALWRTTVAGRRMLILLDNAASEAQVQPLIPGTPGSLVVITSRNRLAGLDHAHPLSLDILPASDALALFTRTVGEQRLAGQPAELVEHIVSLCGRLPLAIRLAAARLRARPCWTPAHLADRLRDQHHCLTELQIGGRGVLAALDLSYRHLTPDQQRLYRLLGLHPGAELDGYAAAALADTTLPQAERLLDDLLDAHLLTEPAPGRHRFHDLIRAHATRTATRDEPEPHRHAALTRLLDHYTHTAAIAMNTVYRHEISRRPHPPSPPATPTPPLTDSAHAAAWLDTELTNLLTIAEHAAEHGWPQHAIHLSATLDRHLCTRGHYTQAHTLHTHALVNARATGDRAGELAALIDLGHLHRLRGRHGQAADCYEQALDISRVTGHRTGELDALNGLGIAHAMRARYDSAGAYYRQAADVARAIGDRLGEFYAHNGFAHIHYIQNRCGPAIEHLELALDLARTVGNQPGELTALNGLGLAHRMAGRYGPATEFFEQALDLSRQIGDRLGELGALNGLGLIHRGMGRYPVAVEHFTLALDRSRAIGSGNNRFEAEYGLGLTLCAAGRADQALDHHRRALDLAADLDQPDDQARAHHGLARAYQALSNHDQARHHWRHALDILTDLDLSGIDGVSTEDIRAHLADLERPARRTREALR